MSHQSPLGLSLIRINNESQNNSISARTKNRCERKDRERFELLRKSLDFDRGLYGRVFLLRNLLIIFSSLFIHRLSSGNCVSAVRPSPTDIYLPKLVWGLGDSSHYFLQKGTPPAVGYQT